MAAGAADALKQFELENEISSTDQIYHYDNAEVQQHLSGKPWTKDPKYFKHVRVSALALVKMVMHARSGGPTGDPNLEVMGLLMGKIDPNYSRGPAIIIMDVFALPVEGTETRVNAQADAYEYMVEFLGVARDAGRMENVIGWYHSHPGYGCWLSGIDCSTQLLNQQYQEPWLAIVIDPNRTAATGKVEIGAFRTYPAGYKPPDAAGSEFESVPLSKIEDFGAHQDQYYQLEISYFKSACDTALLNTIWNKYWIATLSSSPMLANAGYGRRALCAERDGGRCTLWLDTCQVHLVADQRPGRQDRASRRRARTLWARRAGLVRRRPLLPRSSARLTEDGGRSCILRVGTCCPRAARRASPRARTHTSARSSGTHPRFRASICTAR
jgi:COP9 signalosome complex subunit 5